MEKLIDLTYIIEDSSPVYPGDIETHIIQTKQLDINGYNSHKLDISVHSGTHIDAPMHLTKESEYISQFPLESFIGEGCVLDVRNEPIIKMKEEYEKKIKENSIVLLYTEHGNKYGTTEYYFENPIVDISLAEHLIKKNIKIIGMDSPSPDRYPFDIHKLLFQNNIFIIENLTNIHKLLTEDKFEVIAFPLKITADASILRVVARSLISP